MALIDELFKNADLCCTICEAKAGTCDCWAKCVCGWLYINPDRASKAPLGEWEKEVGACGNPVHGGPPRTQKVIHRGVAKGAIK